MQQEGASVVLTNTLIAIKAACCVTLTVMISVLLGYGIKTIKKINNETIPHVNIVVNDLADITGQLAGRDGIENRQDQRPSPVIRCVGRVNDVVEDVAVVSNAIARNVREGRSVVGAATCGNPVQNPNGNADEEPEPIHDIQPEPVIDVGPGIIEQQINGGRPSVFLRMLGF